MSNGQLINPYAAPAEKQSSGKSLSSVDIESQRAIAEVQASIMLAKQFPRDKRGAVDDIINECSRVSLAQQAMYSYARGGTEITGPTIRLAEAIAQAWGNIQFGWNEVGRSAGSSEIEAWAWDTEKNIRRSTKFVVKHMRNTKKGSYPITDERDIYELCANNAARRLRGCILNLIPGDVVEVAINQSQITLEQHFEVTPESIKKLIQAFMEFGVSKDMIEMRIQRRIESITPAQVVNMRSIYNSLKDGMSKASDWFEIVQPAAEKNESSKAETFAASAKSTQEKGQQPLPGNSENKESKTQEMQG